MDKAHPSCLSDSVAGRWQALPGLYLLYKDKESEGVVKVILCLPYELFFIFLSLFSQRHSMLKQQDLSIAMVVTSREVLSALSQLVPCVGCRRSVERLFSQLVESKKHFPGLCIGRIWPMGGNGRLKGRREKLGYFAPYFCAS